MNPIASFFQKVYQYVTAFVVIGSPLFFIPNTLFAPEVTYILTMSVAISVALAAYVVQALVLRTWHTVSKLEFLAYVLFSIALVGAAAFARTPALSLFGEALGTGSVIALAHLMAVMYLVRALPESLRHKLKVILLGLLGIASLVFIAVMVVSGSIMPAIAKLFSGFSSASSLAAYVGLLVIAMAVYLKKAELPRFSKTSKVIIGFSALVIIAWALAIASNDSVRPNLQSSLIVGKEVLVHDGVFGIGANGYSRAWQLYRPQSVIASPYFGSDFSQGFGTTTTLLTTIGIFGMIAFVLLGLAALYSTYRSYREAEAREEKTILGILFTILLYFALIAWVVPLSYAMLVSWMAVAGLGLARAKLTTYHPSKALMFIMVPLALLSLAHAYMTIVKTKAFMDFGNAQVAFSQNGANEEVESLLAKAQARYAFDGFYRWQVEYVIAKERVLVSSPAPDQEALNREYLQNAQVAVDAGLAAVKANPDNYQNYVSLGRAYELAVPFDRQGGYDRAKKSYEEAIKLYPDNPYLYVMLARLEASAGTREGVRQHLTEALRKKQNFADALYLMSQLEASEQKGDEALAYAVEAVKNAPNDPLVYIQAGLLYYGKKDYQNAVAMLQTALQKDPNNANVAYFLALSLRDGGRPDIARQIGEELLKRNPGNSDLEAFLKSIDQATNTGAAKK